MERLATSSSDWSTEQITEFLAAVSSLTDDRAALRGAIERAAEALEAEVGVIYRDGVLAASVGFAAQEVPPVELVDPEVATAVIPGLGVAHVASVPLADTGDGRMVLARLGEEPFTPDERTLLRGMARVLNLVLVMLERQKLLQQLSKIQRSISHGDPLPDVLDAITAGATDLLSAEVSVLRVVDPDDPAFTLLMSSVGLAPDVRDATRRLPIGVGASGRAIMNDRPALIDNYGEAPGAIPAYAEDQLQVVMAAPVHENGAVVGSLTVGSRTPGRVLSAGEQDALLALAEHASLALTDARAVESMREAQRAKDMFLAMVSHELKTPLTVMMGALRTLEVHGPTLPHDLSRDLLASAFDRGKELGRHIDRLLQGAHAQLAGTQADVLVTDMVGTVVRGLGRQGRVAVGRIPGARVSVDRQAVEQVLGILMENAISHSPEETPVVVSATVGDDAVAFTVANRGSLPEDLDPDALFRPFQRGATATSPGVGLGLYIAARTAESIGACITPEGCDGWVRFTFSVPVTVLDHVADDLADIGEASIV